MGGGIENTVHPLTLTKLFSGKIVLVIKLSEVGSTGLLTPGQVIM